MTNIPLSKVSLIKREKRKSLILREVAIALSKISQDEPELVSVHPTRVEFSPRDGLCLIFFSSIDGEEGFNKALEVLKHYKSAMRTVLAKALQGHGIPEIVFKYDKDLEEQERLEKILDELKEQK